MQHEGDDGGSCSVCSLAGRDNDTTCNTMDASTEHAKGKSDDNKSFGKLAERSNIELLPLLRITFNMMTIQTCDGNMHAFFVQWLHRKPIANTQKLHIATPYVLTQGFPV